MKQFFKKILYTLAPIAIINLIAVLMLVSFSVDEDLTYVNYASAFDKEQRLDSLKGENRLVIIGGSNTRFNFHSQLIKDSLGIEPVNMGIHIGLGLDYYFTQVENKLTQGDILLVSAEYEHFFSTETYYGNEGLTDMLLMRHEWVDAFSHLVNTNNYISIYRLIRKRIKRRNVSPEDIDPSMETRTKYNKFGDYIGHYSMPRQDFNVNSFSDNTIDNEVMSDVVERVEKLKERGVKVFFLHPAVCDSFFHLNQSSIKELTTYWKSVGFSVLTSYDDCTYPDQDFYDSIYHLTSEGGEEYSRQMIQLLKNMITD